MKRDQTTTGLGDLNDLIAATEARTHRPRITPREAAGQAIQSALGGLGAGVAVSAVMVYLGVPYVVESAGVVAAVCAGSVMFLRSIADEVVDLRKLRSIQSTAKRISTDAMQRAKAAEARLNLALDELDNLERVNDQLQRDLDTERVVRGQLQQRLADMPRRTNYTPARPEPEPQEVRDAREILRRWYASGDYMSRPKAVEIGWTQERHTAAQRILRDAGVLYVNGKQAKITPQTADEAAKLLSDHLIRIKAQGEPVDTGNQEDDDCDE